MENARTMAVKILLECENNGYSNLILDSCLKTSGLDIRDRAFVTAVVYGTIERRILLDNFLNRCSRKPLNKLDSVIAVILRSGLYQCLYMDSVPVRAAIYESVALTRTFKKSSASGFVNAVLRKASSLRMEALSFANETEKESVQYSVSQPILRLLKKSYPEEWQSVLEASFCKPKQAIRVNTLKISCAQLHKELEKIGIASESGGVENSLILKGNGNFVEMPLFQNGFFQFQGEPSQCAALALQAKEGEHIVDLCAAPGGKSALLACCMKNKGRLDVCDVQQGRLQQAEKSLKRWSVSCASFHCMDASHFEPEFQGADAVLCDVPCSGLGIMSKKPDIRTKSLEGISELVALQKNILETAARYPKKGGRIVYSTCTWNPDENENQITDFLNRHPDYRLQKLMLPPQFGDEKNGMITFLPNQEQSDGFFIAYLERL